MVVWSHFGLVTCLWLGINTAKIKKKKKNTDYHTGRYCKERGGGIESILFQFKKYHMKLKKKEDYSVDTSIHLRRGEQNTHRRSYRDEV